MNKHLFDELLHLKLLEMRSKYVRKFYDLVHLLLQLLVNPVQTPFNIGNKKHITMKDLATEIATNLNVKKVFYEFEENEPNYYVPLINTIETTFDFEPSISLSQGIQKWLWWKRIQELNNFNKKTI